ncbi:hypothetical protein K8T06_00945 [bacterium]|nr:hypothetical protein [bacterium]
MLFTEAYLAGETWKTWTFNTISKGNNIIISLENYFDDNGEYPNSLIDLVPEYLNSIPNQQFKFRYDGFDFSSSGETFQLSFTAGNYTYCVYESAAPKQQWQHRKL